MSDKEKLSVAVGSRSFSYQGVRANRVKDVVDFIVKQGDLVKGAGLSELDVFRANVKPEEAAVAGLADDEAVAAAISKGKEEREKKKAAKAQAGAPAAAAAAAGSDETAAAAAPSVASPAIVEQPAPARVVASEQQPQPSQKPPAPVTKPSTASSAGAAAAAAAANSNNSKGHERTASQPKDMSQQEKQHINEFIMQVLQEPEADLVAALKGTNKQQQQPKPAAADADGAGERASPATMALSRDKDKLAIQLVLPGQTTSKLLSLPRNIKFAELAAAAEKKLGAGAVRLEFQDGDDRIDVDDDDSMEMCLDFFESLGANPSGT
jgi:hypothetical protein